MNAVDDATARGADPGADPDVPPADDGHAAGGDATATGDAAAGTTGHTIGITFKLYATLQDRLPPGAKRNAVPIEVASDVTLHEIIDRYQVPRELAHLVLINGHFMCDADRDERGKLVEGDVLAIWPPVAGG